MMCTSAASSMCTRAAVLNSCNAAASSRRSRTMAADREYYYDLFYSLLEEGRRDPRAALADDDAAAGDGRREAEAGCCPLGRAWKIAIRSFIVAATLLAEAFLAWLVPTCESWSDAFALLASMVMLVMIGAIFWTFTLDGFTDPDCMGREERMQIEVDM